MKNEWTLGAAAAILIGVLVALGFFYNPIPVVPLGTEGPGVPLPSRPLTVVGYWECLPHKGGGDFQTLECALGIAQDASDGHYAINTALMSTSPVDYPTGTKVRVTGNLVAPEADSRYDIDGTIWAVGIEKL